MRRPPIGITVSTWCCLALATSPAIVAAPQSVAGDGRALIASSARLDDEQIRTVLRAAHEAQRGRYVTARLLGAVPSSLRRVDEYWMDEDDGHVRFMRYSTVDSTTQQETIFLTEFTRQPATLCEGGNRRGGTLAINYSYRGGRWHPPHGSVAITLEVEPIANLLDAPHGEIVDDGIQVVDGRRLRSFAWRTSLPPWAGAGRRVLSVWIDPRSLLLARSAISLTMEGRTDLAATGYEYPPPKPIARPTGVAVPDCI